MSFTITTSNCFLPDVSKEDALAITEKFASKLVSGNAGFTTDFHNEILDDLEVLLDEHEVSEAGMNALFETGKIDDADDAAKAIKAFQEFFQRFLTFHSHGTEIAYSSEGENHNLQVFTILSEKLAPLMSDIAIAWDIITQDSRGGTSVDANILTIEGEILSRWDMFEYLPR